MNTNNAKGTILIIEDDEFLRALTAKRLEKEGFKISVAVGGDNAVNVALETKPDLILLDLLLPEVDGFEVLKRLKANTVLKSTPVIVFSNLGQRDDIEKAQKLGADDFMIKANFTLDDVVEKIEHEGHDILIDRQGRWHHGGLPVMPRALGRRLDVVFNALHGEYGEDGQVQNILEQTGIPYTGSGVFASAIGMKKHLAKEVFARHDLRVPRGILLAAPDAERVFRAMAPPWVVKPTDRGSSVGLALAKNFHELGAALERAFAESPNILVEEYLTGREATVGVL
ncbi:MAG: response regulator, partial [Candidatus Vogelbacteria bacterium]|nr:response regulator [Candidatus Vogelbacteria bacterium]